LDRSERVPRRKEPFAKDRELPVWPFRFVGKRETVTGAGRGGFAASGAVGRYWLARCDGFEVCSVDGRLSGVVEGVELDSAGRAATLLVHRRRGHPLELDRTSVAAVDPWERLVVVTLPARRPKAARAASAAADAAARGGHAAWTGAARGGQTAWSGAARTAAASVGAVAAGRRALSPTRRFALWVGARAAYALAFAGWLYGTVVYVVARAAVRVLLAILRSLARANAMLASGLAWTAPRLAHAARRGTRKALALDTRRVSRSDDQRGRGSQGRQPHHGMPPRP
jgi:hypothetical protein